EAELKAKQETELKAKQEAELKAKEETDLKVKEEQQKKEAETKAKADDELKAKQDAEIKAKAESELKAKQEAELKAKAEAETKAKEEAELKATQEEVKPVQARSLAVAKAQPKRFSLNRVFYAYNSPSLTSGIAGGFAPQDVDILDERPGGWIKINTWMGDKWVLKEEKKIAMNKNFFIYHNPSLSGGVICECEPQYVTVVEELTNGWVKIETMAGHKWILPNEKKIYMNKNFFFYNNPSLSSGIVSEAAPQPVGVIEEKDGWVRIHTWLGYKWILPNEKKLYIDRDFVSYDRPSTDGNRLVYFGPQTVTVVEEKGTWVNIRTDNGGLQWVNTKEEEQKWIDFPTVFFAYDNPNFSSNVAGKFAPQSVPVVREQAGGWVLIKTGLGDKWVNKNTLTNQSVILDVPIYKQYPELYNGCEAVSLQMLVEYHTGQRFNKVSFAKQMPMDTTPMVKQGGRYKTWGDPDVGFVGDVTGNRPGYAINPAPLKRLLDQYANGTNLTGHGFGVLENYVRNGKPVVVWVTEGLNSPGPVTTWQTPQGKTIYAKFSTHAVTLTGVDDNYVYYNDPITGQKNARADKSWFENIYNQMGKKALSIN
ncbi:hypothetical protein IIM_05042, partial [Bacillus cereus VD107]